MSRAWTSARSAAGRIGLAVSCRGRLKPFDMKAALHRPLHRSPEATEQELRPDTYHANAGALVGHCDVVTINVPLHPETEGSV